MAQRRTWTRLQKLHDKLAEMKFSRYRRFNMGVWIEILKSETYDAVFEEKRHCVSVGELRKNGAACGTAACLAGWTMILFGPTTRLLHIGRRYSEGRPKNTLLAVENFEIDGSFTYEEVDVEWWAQQWLGLDLSEADYIFRGKFHKGKSIDKLTRRDALAYLRKAIREKNIYVTIGRAAA